MNTLDACIITIGDELLIGQVVDTNSAWMAQELNKIGIAIKHRVAVGDVKEDIWQALDDESAKAPIVLITGGLGPTADDITKPLLCEYFNGNMIMHEATLAHITHIFKNVLQRPMIDRNTNQALVPDVCTVLNNEVGTAPGMLFERDGKIFIAMPGVPHEMKWIMTHHVLPLLNKKFETPFIEHKTLMTFGIGESFLAELIQEEENALPNFVKLAYLPNYGQVRLRLTAVGYDKTMLEAHLNHHFVALKTKVKEFLVTDEDITMQAVVAQLLLKHGKTLSTAESCTGGYIAHVMTAMTGASAYFTGGIVSYDNRIKTEQLGVTEDILQTVGAVSEETVVQMASEVRKKMGTDYSIAVSGIMGPGGGTPEKPVGLVWIAVANEHQVKATKFNLRYDRQRNIEITTINALNMIRMLICG